MQLGLTDAAGLMAGGDPRWWLATNASGRLQLPQATEASALEQMASAGLAPDALLPDGRPLWKAHLPPNSASMSQEGTLRASLEDWMNQQIAAGSASREVIDSRRRNLARIFESTSWRSASAKDQVAYLSRQPAQWVSWQQSDSPLWNKFLAVAKRAALIDLGKTSLASQGPARVALALWVAGTFKHAQRQALPGNEQVPENLMLAIGKDEGFEPKEAELLARALAVSPGLMKPWLDIVRIEGVRLCMEQATPVAKASRSGPRL